MFLLSVTISFISAPSRLFSSMNFSALSRVFLIISVCFIFRSPGPFLGLPRPGGYLLIFIETISWVSISHSIHFTVTLYNTVRLTNSSQIKESFIPFGSK